LRIFNYADDNTLSFCNPDFDALISTLETDSNQLIEWFRINKIYIKIKSVIVKHQVINFSSISWRENFIFFDKTMMMSLFDFFLGQAKTKTGIVQLLC
jgi:hypothetical protein